MKPIDSKVVSKLRPKKRKKFVTSAVYPNHCDALPPEPKEEKRKEARKEPKCQTTLNGFEGSYCAKCKEFFPYAVPNLDDGTMICYSCRNPWMGL